MWEVGDPVKKITNDNEIYLPTGRTVNFKLTSVDVIHSFWIPQLRGKRDAVTNRVNYFFFQAEDGIRDKLVTGVQTCALPIWGGGAWTGPKSMASPPR